MTKHFFILFYGIESHACLSLVCSFLGAAPLTVCPESLVASVGPLFPFCSFLLLLAVKVSQHHNLANWQCVKACAWLQSHHFAFLAWWPSKLDNLEMLTACPWLACGPHPLIVWLYSHYCHCGKIVAYCACRQWQQIVCLTSHSCDSAKISACLSSLLPVTFLPEVHRGAMP